MRLKKRYRIKTGFSCHSGDTTACLAATALGAELLEFHVVFDRRMFGPDAKASIEIDEVAKLVNGVREIRTSVAALHTKDEQAKEMVALKQMFGKSLSVNKDLPAGHIISFEDLEAKKPAGFGIAPAEYTTVIGKRLAKDMKRWEFLNNHDLQLHEKKSLRSHHCTTQLQPH